MFSHLEVLNPPLTLVFFPWEILYYSTVCFEYYQAIDFYAIFCHHKIVIQRCMLFKQTTKYKEK